MDKMCKRSGWQDNGSLESHKDMSSFLSQAALPQAVHARQDEVNSQDNFFYGVTSCFVLVHFYQTIFLYY